MIPLPLNLTLLGSGSVMPDATADDLLPPEPRIAGPICLSAQNLRLLDGFARVRSGYEAIGTAPDTDRVNGAYTAVFDTTTVLAIRATASAVNSLSGTTYTDITGAASFTGDDDDYWAFDMAPRAGSVSPKNLLLLANGIDNLYSWTGTGNIASVASAPSGGKVLLSFIGRAFLMNVLESGNRRSYRVHRSVVGDSTDWSTSPAAGFNDLDADAWPIAAAAAFQGRMLILKGDRDGGSFWVGIPTGLVTDPIEYQPLNKGAGVGILLRRALVKLPDGSVLFVGHDGLYQTDGNQFERLISREVRALLGRINQGALDAAVAWYKPTTAEVHIAIPVGESTVPTETWIFQLVERRLYGPYSYADTITAAANHVQTAALTWPTFDYPGGWPTIPYSAWSKIGSGTPGAPTILLGTNGGLCLNDTDAEGSDDNGVPITGSYRTGPIRAEGRAVGPNAVLDSTTLLTLHAVTLNYAAALAWTPLIEVSIDAGNSWTSVASGTTLAAASGQLKQKTYAIDPITAHSIEIRVSGSSMKLMGIRPHLTVAGDAQHD